METFGNIMQPAEHLDILCLLAQRPETELNVPARQHGEHQGLGNLGNELVTAMRSERKRGKQPSGKKTLIRRIEPFAAVAPVFLPHK